jgi:hypothetical protein
LRARRTPATGKMLGAAGADGSGALGPAPIEVAPPVALARWATSLWSRKRIKDERERKIILYDLGRTPRSLDQLRRVTRGDTNLKAAYSNSPLPSQAIVSPFRGFTGALSSAPPTVDTLVGSRLRSISEPVVDCDIFPSKTSD